MRNVLSARRARNVMGRSSGQIGKMTGITESLDRPNGASIGEAAQPQPRPLRDDSSETNVRLVCRALDAAIPPARTYRPTHRTGHKCVVGLAKKATYILGARQNVPAPPPRREHSEGVGLKHLAPNPGLIRAGRPMVRDLERGSPGLGSNWTVENLHPTGTLQVGSEQDGNIVHLYPQHNGQMIRRDIGDTEVGLAFPRKQSPDRLQEANELVVMWRQRANHARPSHSWWAWNVTVLGRSPWKREMQRQADRDQLPR